MITKFIGVSQGREMLSGIPSDGFQEIFALDLFQIHPDLEKGIGELARALKKEGTLFLNFFSKDHFHLAHSLAGADGQTSLAKVAAIPRITVTPERVGEIAGRHGLLVRRVIPYSSFYGNSLWLDLMKSRFRWERILDWLSTDEALFNFALFLEETLASSMGCISSPRFAVVLEKSGNPGSGVSSPTVEALPSGLGLPALIPQTILNQTGMSRPQLQASLAAHLSEIRNLVFFHHLWKLLPVGVQEHDADGWSAILPDSTLDVYRKWDAQERIDDRCIRTVRGWYKIPEIDQAMNYRGIPLGPGLEYEQFRVMLSEVFGCFGDGRPK